MLAADQAFYDALTAQAVLEVAKQTVNARQATQTQENQMTANKLKSTLDLSFANVNLSQSQLLQLDAQNNADATMAALDAVLGLDHEVTYRLIDDSTQNSAPPSAFEPLIQTALAQRPDSQSLTFGEQSAQIGVTAELLKQANMALQLAQTRYQLGLSAIVELSQAQR